MLVIASGFWHWHCLCFLDQVCLSWSMFLALYFLLEGWHYNGFPRMNHVDLNDAKC
jgi:hypothetical protein